MASLSGRAINLFSSFSDPLHRVRVLRIFPFSQMNIHPWSAGGAVRREKQGVPIVSCAKFTCSSKGRCPDGHTSLPLHVWTPTFNAFDYFY